VRLVLAAMATTVVHMGDSGAGRVTRLCKQLVVGFNLQGVCEAIALGRAAGVDLDKLRDALLGGAAASWMMQNLAPKILARDADDAGFRNNLMLKGLRLTGELAFALGAPPPAMRWSRTSFSRRAHAEGHNGNQALYRVYDRLCNQET
jgi:2-hydroxy-3-oxopropionate reductase